MKICPFCGHDPFHRVNNGVGMEAVAVTCCELGMDLFGGQPAPETVTLLWDEFVELADKLSHARALRTAAEQCLDDMGDDGHSVCEQAKLDLIQAVC